MRINIIVAIKLSFSIHFTLSLLQQRELQLVCFLQSNQILKRSCKSKMKRRGVQQWQRVYQRGSTDPCEWCYRRRRESHRNLSRKAFLRRIWFSLQRPRPGCPWSLSRRRCRWARRRSRGLISCWTRLISSIICPYFVLVFIIILY